MHERNLIEAFVSHLGKRSGCPMLAVDRWPDKENRQSTDIDAIAGLFAIEHTSIDRLVDQRREDDWFLRVVGGLDRVIASSVDCGFTITLRYDAIAKGMNWNSVRADLRRWIQGNAAALSHGSHTIILPTSVPVEPPILMCVWKGQPRCTGFARFEPWDDTLATRTKKLLDRKAGKLIKYNEPDITTVLVVENDDIALMDKLTMLGAIQGAYPDGLPHGVDEIWFADTSIPDKPQFHDFTTLIAESGRRLSPSHQGSR